MKTEKTIDEDNKKEKLKIDKHKTDEHKIDKLEIERQRIFQMAFFENELYKKGSIYIAGIDEVGRGPLAGPVVAAAVILRKDAFIYGVNDSKKLSPAKRNELFEVIRSEAIAIGVGIIGEKEIDEINILNATKKAMLLAVSQLKPYPDTLLIDAVKLEGIELSQLSIIKGDMKSISIAAASIIAKVTRDRMMDEFCLKYPEYGFSKHKGYGTSEHIVALRKCGPCEIHRRSFIKNFCC